MVGGSGHGKSTIVALLQRLYAPRIGALTIDDIDASTVTPRALRAFEAVVQQLVELFNRSVFDNIGYTLPEGVPITPEAVEGAAKATCEHSFIANLL